MVKEWFRVYGLRIKVLGFKGLRLRCLGLRVQGDGVGFSM